MNFIKIINYVVIVSCLCQALMPQSANAEELISNTIAGDANSLQIVYFFSPSCEDCHRVKQALPAIMQHWGERIQLVQRSIDDLEVFKDLLLYEEHYGVEVNAPPIIFVGTRYLKNTNSIISGLDKIIGEELAQGTITFIPSTPWENKATAESNTQEEVPPEILERFESFGVWAVVVAGLIDGVNPCAFTTIIFLLSMLAHLGKDKRQLAVVGTGFTVSIFVTYLLLGLGLFGAIKSFSVSSGLSSGLACGVGVLAFALAAWSFWDFIQYKRTKDIKKVSLGLPKSVKAKIHKVIRNGLTTKNLLAGSIGIGFFIALLESVCTGQVYLPTIVFVARAPGLRANAIAYLVLYNLMFILPLVGILVIAYMGVKSEQMGSFLQRNLAASKLGMAILFAALGVLVIATM